MYAPILYIYTVLMTSLNNRQTEGGDRETGPSESYMRLILTISTHIDTMLQYVGMLL